MNTMTFVVFTIHVAVKSSRCLISLGCLLSMQGHDTVSAAIAHAVHLLGANLDEQHKCQQELDEIMGGCLIF